MPVEIRDLTTFPEAFLPSGTLIEALRSLEQGGVLFGCIHVGLRPDGSADDHLFSIAKLNELTKEIGAISPSLAEDLGIFRSWLGSQAPGSNFNIAALFTRDALQHLRICLHAKLVRSTYEVGLSQETHMTEANLLSLVTLVPSDPTFLSITIHPLICADILRLSLDSSRALPIEAITSQRQSFEEAYAEHVDVVSVSTCTPNTPVSGGVEWHQDFREAFRRAAADDTCSRHRFAAFVLSNYRSMKGRPAGLSGVFVPLPWFGAIDQEHETKTKTVFGHFEATDEHEANRWVVGTRERLKEARKAGLGYIVALREDQCDASSIATMFAFTLTRLPRDANRWSRTGSVASLSVRNGFVRASASSVEVVFGGEVAP